MKQLLTALVCGAIMISTAAAQVEKGDKEVQLQGYLVAIESATMFTVQMAYGVFVTPNIEIGVGPAISYSSFDVGGESEDNTTLSAAFFGRYNFSVDKKQVPYLSAQWYQYDFSPDDPMSFTDASFLQFGGGMKFFVSEYVAYDVSANYGFGLGGGSGAFTIMGGLSAFF